MEYRIEIIGDGTLAERDIARQRARDMTTTHPECLAGNSIAFRFNKLRIFLTPVKIGSGIRNKKRSLVNGNDSI